MRNENDFYIPSRRIEKTFLAIALLGAGTFLFILALFAQTLLVFE